MNGLRKPRQPRPISTDPPGLAKVHATRLTETDVSEAMRLAPDGVRALREGVATHDQWCWVVAAIDLASAIEAQAEVRGAIAHICAAQRPLDSITRQAMATGTWRPRALYYLGLDDISTAVDLHDFQLQQLSYGAYCRATNHAITEVRSAGGVVIDINAALQQKAKGAP